MAATSINRLIFIHGHLVCKTGPNDNLGKTCPKGTGYVTARVKLSQDISIVSLGLP